MKTAIVTGCSRGIGRAITEMLLAEGWHVTGVARTAPEPKVGRGRSFVWLKADIATAPADFWSKILTDDEDTVDALVHCAGVRGPFGPFLENKAEAWERTIAVNLLGTARVVRAVLPALQRSDDGRVLLFSGGGAFSPEPLYSAYAATKGATVALAETLAEELRETTVSVNTIAPGFIATDIHRGTPNEHRKDNPEALANVVACVRHLLGPSCRGLTGRTIAAQWDDWPSIDQTNVDLVNASNMGLRDRHKIQCVRDLAIPRYRRAV